MKLCTDHLQTRIFFYHGTPHHSTDRYHQFFPMDETPIATPIPFSWHSSWKNANEWHPIWVLLPRIFLYNSTPRGQKTDWLKWPTTLRPIEFYSSFRCALADPTFFGSQFFCHSSCYPALLSLCTLCYHAKSQVKTTACTERADRAARIHKCSNQVSLEEELDQISAADAVWAF